jgi:hypothetical protein
VTHVSDMPRFVERRKTKDDKRRYMRVVPPDQVRTTSKVGRRHSDVRSHEEKLKGINETIRRGKDEDNPLLRPFRDDSPSFPGR